MMEQKRRVAFVTGGSRGIGVGICQVLLQAGYFVAIGYRVEEERAQKIAEGHENAMTVQVDISDSRSVQAAFETIKNHWGPVSILVNNAAMAQEKPFLEITDADWEKMLSVNLLGAVRCIREALPEMIQDGFGRIINMSSIGGQWGGMNQVHYAASKAALINLTRSMAKLYSSQGVTTNAISPGLVETDMVTAELASSAGQEKVKTIPMGRLGYPTEVGAGVLYLASPEAAYVTGQTLNLNGGMYFD